ncbi:hypothetical protein DPEC_G00100760 [Dallia pectoralis]|uniref:Uncharacterized protein n=1 Tax=Dallia pectoralis TaxID=75939 RepID=A0ACC2GWI1_DALPE|nr:hypothetical protein DPEC_G00100760 [Dallia pectoralis]
MSESGNAREVREQIAGYQYEDQDLQSEAQLLVDSSETRCLKETNEAIRQSLTDLQGKLNKDDNAPEGPRRSERIRNPTEKMRALQYDEAKKVEKRLLAMYEQWKLHTREARDQLKTYMSESQLWLLIEQLKKDKEDLMNVYYEIRNLITPSADIRRRVDTCESMTTEITNIAYNRAIDDENEFDEQKERHRLHELLRHNHAKSVYGSAASSISHSQSDHYSIPSVMTAKRADAAAELAVKEAHYQMLLEEERQKELIRELEEQQRKALEAQKRELERLQAEKEIRAARAKLESYNKETERENANYVKEERNVEAKSAPLTASPPPLVASPCHTGIPSFAQIFQDSIALNRLPVPEPYVFNGDPIQFIEWKSAFTSLIDQRVITPAEKLYYLKKYVGGPARQVLEGTFYRNDNEAYQDAWNRLNHRFGQPFAIQRAFREKLNSWPRILPKDAEGLRRFSDFLNACQDAMPHVKGLDILNDCQENQKIVHKLPDWAALRWNRQVTKGLNENGEFPSFKEFARFTSTEAEIACNPITSFHALHPPDTSTEKGNLRDVKKNEASALNTQTVNEHNNHKSEQWKVKTPCILCQDSRHQLHACSKFTDMVLGERPNYIREKKLCYGCLKPGHSARDCRHRHSCDQWCVVAAAIVGDVAEAIVGDVAEAIVGDVAEAIVGDVAEAIVGDVAEAIVGDVAEAIVGGVAAAIVSVVVAAAIVSVVVAAAIVSVVVAAAIVSVVVAAALVSVVAAAAIVSVVVAAAIVSVVVAAAIVA